MVPLVVPSPFETTLSSPSAPLHWGWPSAKAAPESAVAAVAIASQVPAMKLRVMSFSSSRSGLDHRFRHPCAVLRTAPALREQRHTDEASKHQQGLGRLRH